METVYKKRKLRTDHSHALRSSESVDHGIATYCTHLAASLRLLKKLLHFINAHCHSSGYGSLIANIKNVAAVSRHVCTLEETKREFNL